MVFETYPSPKISEKILKSPPKKSKNSGELGVNVAKVRRALKIMRKTPTPYAPKQALSARALIISNYGRGQHRESNSQNWRCEKCSRLHHNQQSALEVGVPESEDATD